MNFFIIMAVVFVFMAAYCATLFSILRKIPEDKNIFPRWFVWFFLIPIVGFIFQWIMTPFGIPLTLKNATKNNQNAQHVASMLSYLGFFQVLMPTIGLFISHGTVSAVIAALGIAAWITYWITIVWFSKKYL